MLEAELCKIRPQALLFMTEIMVKNLREMSLILEIRLTFDQNGQSNLEYETTLFNFCLSDFCDK